MRFLEIVLVVFAIALAWILFPRIVMPFIALVLVAVVFTFVLFVGFSLYEKLTHDERCRGCWVCSKRAKKEDV